MDSKELFGCNYLQLKPEEASVVDLGILLFSSKLSNRKFIECTEEVEARDFRQRWLLFTSVVAQILLLATRNSFKKVENILELWLNLLSFNGGFIGLFLNFLRGKVKTAERSSASFLSVVGNTDTRVDLDKNIKQNDAKYKGFISMMASKLSYENEQFVGNTVRNLWNMEFMGLHSFWNDYQELWSTRAIILQDTKSEPNLIIVAFRGTEPFDADQWRTDVDISWYELPNVGRVHGGFMKALGLQKNSGWPKEIDQRSQHRYAYYTIREKLRTMLEANRDAKFILAGHSSVQEYLLCYPKTLFTMSLSNGADATSNQQKPQLPNPFDLTDSEILEKVYVTHLHDDDKCDVDVLFDVVSSVVLKTRLAESKAYQTVFKPEFSTMKLISCQMITTPRGDRYVHQTTMCILHHLRSYSWDSKALVTLAAFALEYGNLLHLSDVVTPDNLLTNSLKQLNQIQTRKDPKTILVALVMKVLQDIQEWTRLSSFGYDIVDVPSLSDALQEVPVVVYWIIASLIAATGNLVGVSDYVLSHFVERLSSAASRFKEHLKLSGEQKGYADEYYKRKKAFSNPKDVVELLKLLIGSKVQIYDGSIKSNRDIDVFDQKYVLLFISSLDKIEDEISLLNSIYDRLQENPSEIIKNYKKEDFKILWIPIVTLWDDKQRLKFNALKDTIKWYAVEFFTELPGTDLIKEKFNYRGKPIIPVLTPLADTLNEDAMDLIFQWGIDAFPFRKIDGIDLTLKWKWLWDATKKANLGIQQVTGDRYIFIYGGADKKWVQDFAVAVEKTKGHAIILNTDTIIDQYELGKDDPRVVPRFWIEIERKRLKKHKDAVDSEIQKIVRTLLCLKQDQQGWAILTKGSNVRVLGHGEPMRQTLVEFDAWKEKVFQKEGFDVAFDEYYKIKLNQIYARQQCAIVKNNADVLVTITCPNPTCARVMEVTSVNYKCCHRDAPNTGNI